MPDQVPEVPEEIIKLAQSLYVPAFIEKCAMRGYTHIDSENLMKQALEIVDRLKQEQDKQQMARNELAKEASAKISSRSSKTSE